MFTSGRTAALSGSSETGGKADENFNNADMDQSGPTHANNADESSLKAYDLGVILGESQMLTLASAVRLPDSPPVC